jgi:hypothetical protein
MTRSKWWRRVGKNARATHWTSAAASTVALDRKSMPLWHSNKTADLGKRVYGTHVQKIRLYVFIIG